MKSGFKIMDSDMHLREPADLPVEAPMKFEMKNNLQTAKTLGLTIRPIVLMRAQKVIR